jgi:hypothetical protein
MQTEIFGSVRLFNKGCYDDPIVNHFLFQVLNKYNKKLQIQIDIFRLFFSGTRKECK